MKNAKNPLLLEIDFDPARPLPWCIENGRSALRNEHRAATIEGALDVIGDELRALERTVAAIAKATGTE